MKTGKTEKSMKPVKRVGQVYELVRRLFPEKTLWSGQNTYRLHWGGQFFCKNKTTGGWYIKLRAFKHNWQWSNIDSLPNVFWKDRSA